ncbi:hypothetical protein FHETE_7120 [Fusarium heterosporum]|uniref:CBM-cenC domain-containing protein n=1 Tax=Fusarium heterosporum TaxID=42747 RepID=A0A8H5T797_FUSHE|nr:hypothetical protein FHETE_7120 [Fusarium heterosporum]
MVNVRILNLAVIATLVYGTEAGPCRPTGTAATSVAETTSTLASGTLATSIASTTVTTSAGTTTTNLDDGTTTALADPTTTTQVEFTTTTAASACVESQLSINPGFDDSTSDDIEPWTSNMYLTQNQPQSGANALSAFFNNGQPDYYVKQSLQNLNGDYEFSYYYKVVSVSAGADYVCNIELKVGDTSIVGGMDDSVGGWRSDSVSWSSAGETIAQADIQLSLSCLGEFTGIEVDIDTLAFTRVCSA